MKVLDLFSGCGGFSYGFMKAGFEVIGFVECWEPAIQTYKQNHPDAIHIGTDITKISDNVIARYKEKIDVIIGGPPCQGFSLCGKRNKKDNRNQLYKEYLRFVRIIQPKAVVMENVQGLLSMDDCNNRKVIDRIIHDLISLGYSVCYKVLNASDYGVPQRRKRLFIIGLKIPLFLLRKTKEKTVNESLTNLPHNAHLFFNTSQEVKARIKQLNQGERLSKNYNFSRQRLVGDKPSKTVATKPLFIHPYYDRFLTPRELARLQSFPDKFLFAGSKTNMVKQIGNAVPPKLAQTIAIQLKEVMFHV